MARRHTGAGVPVDRQRRQAARPQASTQSVALIVKGHASRLGLDPGAFSGHSLRSGFITL
jgi:hypothetical protein